MWRKTPALYCLILSALVLMPAFNVATDLYSAPIFLLLIFSVFQRDFYRLVYCIVSRYWLAFVSLCLALVSCLWADNPDIVLASWRNELLIPFLGLLVYCFFTLRLDEESAKRVLFGVVALFVLLSIIGFVWFGYGGIFRIFYDNGYYTTYVVVVFSAFLPFVKSWSRIVFYSCLAFCFFLTGQRVVWLLLPVMAFADFICSGGKRNYRAIAGLVFVALGSILVLKYLQSVRPADAFDPHVKPSGLLAYLMANERLYLWGQWLNRGLGSPWLGIGFGRDNALAHFSQGGVWPKEYLTHAHNMILNQFVQLGLVGVSLLVATYGQLLKGFSSALKNRFAWSGLFVLFFFFLRNLTDDYELRRIMMFYLGMLGLCLGPCLNEHVAKSDSKPQFEHAR
ncbi:O-antigen ligase family protein [Pseudogulbenkiania ferrooxidans]|uniref:O-antigen ligase family protein n=1 Tax=Pseudogulbenkiania ferrooxidans TaxID=549169 RepID=UPI00135F1A8D|nr:O-antigen ligase family protein [Pseudogulbenkiania ferrooxidans]